jgi:hypothetical protein
LTPRFAPQGPGGSGSPASSLLPRRCDSLPPVPPHFVAFAWRYRTGRLRFRFRGRQPTNAFGPGRLFSRNSPHPLARCGNDRISHVPGEPPLCLCPVLRPRQVRSHQTFTVRRRGPRSVQDEGSRIRSFGAQSHGFGTRCLRFAVTGYLVPTQDSLPAVGQTLTGGLRHPQGSFEGFLICLLHLILPSQASWRKDRHLFRGRRLRRGPKRRRCRRPPKCPAVQTGPAPKDRRPRRLLPGPAAFFTHRSDRVYVGGLSRRFTPCATCGTRWPARRPASPEPQGARSCEWASLS